MRKLAFLILACLIFRGSMGQDSLFENIAERLGDTSTEVRQLWPFEEEVMEYMAPDSKFKVGYKLPFKDGKASEMTFDFETIKLFKSAAYEHSQMPLGVLADLVREQMPEGFQLEFEQESPDAFGMLFAKDEEGQDSEVYFFSSGGDKSELLYFKLSSAESRHLRVNLNSKLAYRKVDIFEVLQSQFPEVDFEIREVWSPQEAYALSDPKNNPKEIIVQNVGFRIEIPLPLAGMEDLEIQVETKQLIDGVFLLAKKEQVAIGPFGEAVRKLIPEGFENQISHRSGDRAFELFTLPQSDSDLVLYFSQSEKMAFVYYAEVEKGADYISNLILEINKKFKPTTL